jgi:tetratricopeptide (TPR) repeat protein
MRRAPLAAAVALFALAFAVQPALRAHARAFPPLSSLPATPYALQDAALVSGGLRAVAADMAWVQMLQYSAGGLPEMTDAPDRPYDHLKDLSLRVVRLDPSFQRGYLYAAGILAWFHNIDRPDEAVEILREGMRADPTVRLYPVYIAAIAFKKKGDVDKMVALLESTLPDPHSPVEMKAILANLYKTRGEYAKALAVWDAILDDADAEREWPRARIQVGEIKALLKAGRAPR